MVMTASWQAQTNVNDSDDVILVFRNTFLLWPLLLHYRLFSWSILILSLHWWLFYCWQFAFIFAFLLHHTVDTVRCIESAASQSIHPSSPGHVCLWTCSNIGWDLVPTMFVVITLAKEAPQEWAESEQWLLALTCRERD